MTEARPLPVDPVADGERRLRAVLEERARALAEVPAVSGPDEAIDVLSFAIGGERFAVESRHVVGVFRVAALSLLPPAASPLVAITEWRGELLTLVDLRRALGYATDALNDRSLVLALGKRHAALGILVDVVHAHESLPLGRVSARPNGGHPLVRGLTDDATLLLDARALLDPAYPHGHRPPSST